MSKAFTDWIIAGKKFRQGFLPASRYAPGHILIGSSFEA